MKSTTIAGVVAGLVAFVAAPSALAAPVTVDLRVEGPTRTLVEQKVTVDVRPFKFSDSDQTYKCDGTGSNGSAATPSPTRGGALTEAAAVSGFELTGTFSAMYESPTIERIAGEAIPPYSQDQKFLAEYKNGVGSGFGACGDPIAEGDDVLFAYADGSEQLLRLAGPATVKPGETATLTVTDQANATPVSGAAVGGRTSTADGRITTAPLTQRGPQSFKASKAGAIRSNAVAVCVTDGADGFCGTTVPGTAPAAGTPGPTTTVAPDKAAAFAKIGSLTEGKRFEGRGPRTLAGKVDVDAAGLKDVRLRLSRTDGKRCTRYDGTRERFVTTRKCGVKNARTFSVGSDATFSYLLPSALPRGRYVLDVIVIDRAGNQTATYQRGRNRVVFFVD
jgi:hypothetical protein